MPDLRQILDDLSGLHGVSGSEQPVVRYLRDAFTAFGRDVEVDSWGNLTVTSPGEHPELRLIIGAHSDEIGFYVKSIDRDGFLRVEPVGGVPMKHMAGRPVMVREVPGVIGAGAWHLGKSGDGPIFIDVGASSAAEAMELGVKVGDPVAVVGQARPLGPNRLSGKAMDNRVACAILLKLFERIASAPHFPTVVGVVTVQEEVGLRGARMVAEGLNASAAISVDIMPSGDTPDCDGINDSTVQLGKGPVVTLYDQVEDAFAASMIGLVGHPALNARILEVASDAGIEVQPNVLIGGGADAAAFHLAGGGTPATQLSIPTRYSHTMVETIDVRDVEQTIELLAALIESLEHGIDFGFI